MSQNSLSQTRKVIFGLISFDSAAAARAANPDRALAVDVPFLLPTAVFTAVSMHPRRGGGVYTSS
jgi:hypothetical protein